MTLYSCGIYTKYESKKEVRDNLYGTSANIEAAKAMPSVAQLSWREMFEDPMLQQLIDSALVRNTDLRSARIAVEKAQVALKTAKLAYLPSLALAPTGSLSSFDNSPVSKTYNLPLQLDWQIDIFGTLTNQKRKQAALTEQTKLQEEKTRANVIATVARLYVQLQNYDRQLEILLETEKLWSASLEMQKALMDNGKAYSTAVNQMEASYINIKTQIVDMRKSLHSMELEMCRVLAIEPQHVARSAWGLYHLPETLGVGFPAQMLANRPDVKAADKAMEEAFYNTAEARSAFYPSLNLSGLLGWTNNGGGVVTNPGKLLWNAVATLTQPIFARGKLKGNLEISKLSQEDMANRYVQIVINAGNEVNEALADYQTTVEKDALYKRQVAVLQDAYMGTHELMNNGKANYLEVITAQETLLQAQLREAINQYDAAQSVIALYVALGGATK